MAVIVLLATEYRTVAILSGVWTFIYVVARSVSQLFSINKYLKISYEPSKNEASQLSVSDFRVYLTR